VRHFLESGELETLYARHGAEVFNLCLRVTGSRDVAAAATEAAFLEALPDDGARVTLLAAAREATARLVEAGAAYGVAEPTSSRVRDANARLGVQHREVLALRDLLGCPFGEIAQILGTGRDTVPERIWRARLELRDELEGSRLRAIAPVARSCRDALALMVMDWDEELDDDEERAWLQRHLRTCGKCRLSRQALREASAAYRQWMPAAAPPGLRESLLGAAEGSLGGEAARGPAALSGTSSRRPPGSPPRDAPRAARLSPG
jgi:DNA-directed RNA polymerase specialized sigma24 family protein